MKNLSKAGSGVGLLLLGAIFVFLGAQDGLEVLRFVGWPATAGTLLQADVSHPWTPASGFLYSPAIRYTYTVGGQGYEGTNDARPRAREEARSQEQARMDRLWRQQRTQGHVTVRYNPALPSQSVLQEGLPPSSFLWLTLGLPFLLVGLGAKSSSIRPRLLFTALGLGGLCGTLPTQIASRWCPDLALSGWMVAVWGGCMALGGLLARRHPAYVHADQGTGFIPAPVTSAPAAPTTTDRSGAADSGGMRWAGGSRVMGRGFLIGLGAFLMMAALGAVFAYEPWAQSRFNGELFVFFLGLALVMGLLYGGIATWRAGQRMAVIDDQNGAYREFSQRVTGVLTEGEMGVWTSTFPSVTFSHQGTNVRLDTEFRGSFFVMSSALIKPLYERLTFDLPQPAPFRCSIYPQGSLTPLGTLLGAQDVQVGWDLFDDQFVVKANDETTARSLLTGEVPHELLQLKQWVQEHLYSVAILGYVELTIGEGTVQVRVSSLTPTVGNLMAFYRSSGRIYDRVRDAL